MSLIWENRQNDMPGTHVLIVGAGHYPHFPGHTAQKPLGQVNMCAHSALDLAQWMIGSLQNPAAPLQSVRLLISDANVSLQAQQQYDHEIRPATVGQVRAAFRDWKRDLAAVPGSVAVFYFAGHGFGNGENQCLLMEDYNLDDAAALDGAINYTNLSQSVNAITNLSGAWFFIDACRDATVEQTARDNWGLKLDHKVPFLATSVPCFQLFAAASGRQALGVDGQPTFFARALKKALSENGYAESPDGWAVKAFALHGAVAGNLELISEEAKIPKSKRQRAEARTPEPNQPLHFRSADNPPAFLVKVTCQPEEHNACHTFSYEIQGSNNWVSREPDAAAWYANVPPGFYQFKAVNGAGKATHAEKIIQLHFVEVYLKGVV
ncbi:caspase family protein [Undibacterium crateris]|uniref:caspase family protein n=1 Tax=Undibacterium crateris TaxID=2528175 RepID=UPI001389FFF1|nr:caspase family protein [Undibacterium crateris]NDI85469.1 hypothetical protein [Undibacterium crateris]